MGEPHWYKLDMCDTVMDYVYSVEEYNNSAAPDEIFTGIHFDIEPHTLPEWQSSRGFVLMDWSFIVDSYTSYVRQHMDIELSASVPFSLSGVPYNSGFFSEFMMEKHDKIAIMAYRDFAVGQDSICYHSQPFIDQAWKCKSIVVGVETKPDLLPEKVTFADEGKAEMYHQLEIVERTLSPYPTYGGIAIHSVKHWSNM
jgi:hypothetical protein